MKRVRLFLVAAGIAVMSLVAVPAASACPNCPHKGAKCECAKKDGKCDCAKKDEKAK